MRNVYFSAIAFTAIASALHAADEQQIAPQAPVTPTSSGYVAPAGINIGTPGDYDFFLTSSFLYWQIQQDNLVVGLVQDGSSVTTTPNSYLSNSFVEIDPGFTPGFQVGIGMNLQNDNWEGLVDYTRVHGSYSVSSNGSNPSGISIYVTDRLQAIFPPEMGAAISSTSSTVTPAYTSLSSTYKSHLDFIDAEMARTFYLGKSLTLRAAMGLRSAWIQQSLSSTYQVTVDPTTARRLDVKSESNSWGFGPRFGALLDWSLGKGFSLLGSLAGDILYTWYHIQDKTSVHFFNPQFSASRAGVNSNTFTTSDHPRALRPHTDMEMGVHWGSYFCNNNFHLDFAATYGFQVFFDQNMFRHWDGLLPAWSTAPHGNLYVNGLTFSARFDF